ncbi:hypothetical protein GCM10027036_07740 [Flavihumibacter cheonanensis]|uniref:hypothetical protein n=1 Tax=Flavihumibacter cheonanensis TaxID=1442385 RepID=UPI001EF7B7E5|nr:hypothetical protein [Flavihumibacter cheonanensis]MCG7751783.1 hypothetical protein [Flavihumibacter cheonanensis]
MENTTQLINFPPFNEAEWIRLIFLLSDTQQWMNQMILNAFFQVPLKDRKKLFRKSYYITVTALAHILERHYYTIPRHPAASKFTVPLIELLSYLRDASTEPASPIPGTLQFKRTLALDKTIGIDLDHVPTCLLTILTDAGGRIITAFPGSYKSIPNL